MRGKASAGLPQEPIMTTAADRTYDLLLKLQRSIQLLHQKVDIVTSQQDEIDADVVELGNAITAIQDEITALQNANPALDLSALKAAADRVADIAPPAAP
jgi:chromosome segregation ATPase